MTVGVDVHLTLDPKERHLINIVKMERSVPMFENPQDIEMKPPSPKTPKLDEHVGNPKDCSNEVEMMELYRKSFNDREDENPKEPFELGIESFFGQLESNSKKDNETFATGSAEIHEPTNSSTDKDFKAVYEREMTKILRKPYQVPPSRDLKGEFYKEVKKVLAENECSNEYDQ